MLPKSSYRIGTSIGDSLTKCHHLRLEQFMQLWNNSLHSNMIHLLVSLTEMNYESRPYSLKLQQPQSERKSHTHTNQARTNFSKAVRNILRSLMLKVKCTDATEILWLRVEESNMVFSYWFTFSLNLRGKCLLSSDSCIFHIIKDIEEGSYIELRRLWVCDTWVGYSFGVWLECLVMFQLSRIAWS